MEDASKQRRLLDGNKHLVNEVNASKAALLVWRVIERHQNKHSEEPAMACAGSTALQAWNRQHQHNNQLSNLIKSIELCTA
jgi:hypothetical protein